MRVVHSAAGHLPASMSDSGGVSGEIAGDLVKGPAARASGEIHCQLPGPKGRGLPIPAEHRLRWQLEFLGHTSDDSFEGVAGGGDVAGLGESGLDVAQAGGRRLARSAAAKLFGSGEELPPTARGAGREPVEYLGRGGQIQTLEELSAAALPQTSDGDEQSAANSAAEPSWPMR